MRLRWIAVIIVVFMVGLAALLTYSVGVRQKVDNFNTDDPTDPADPVDPVTPPVTPPAKPKPVVVGTFSSLTLQFSVTKSINRVSQEVYYLGSAMAAPTVNLAPYTGTADPVYEWRQLNPASIGASQVVVKYSIQVNVEADFASTQYTFGGSPYFVADWTGYANDAQFNWAYGQYNTQASSHTWSTGNIYYWEHGSYNVWAKLTFQVWSGTTLLIDGGSNTLLFNIHITV